MATHPIMQQLRRVVLSHEDRMLTDGQLLGNFIVHHDAGAFEFLVRRHGPMVWGVCRRALPNVHDAEEAFQATFLVLARKATSVSPRERVGNWLYGVARTTALRVKAANAKRRLRERQVTDLPETAAVLPEAGEDLQALVDRELARLPDKYREVIVLCDLEGQTRKAVARQLKIPEGTVASRQATARKLLAERLRRRGFAGSGGLLVSACVPRSLVASTVDSMTAGAAPQVMAVAKGVLKTMLVGKLKKAAAVVLVLSLVVVASGVQVGRTERPPVERDGEPSLATARDEDEQLQGEWMLIAREQDGKKQDFPQGAGITVAFAKGELGFRVDPIDPLGKPREARTTVHAYRLDTKQRPNSIELLDAKGEAFMRGIYTLRADRLVICWSLPGNEAWPTDFTAKRNSNRILTMYQQSVTASQTRSSETVDSWANRLFRETQKDFGVCKRGELVKYRFEMTNPYAVPLDISAVRTTCGCLTSRLSTTTLKPTENAYLEVTVDCRRFSGRKTMLVYVTVGPEYTSTATLKIEAVSRAEP